MRPKVVIPLLLAGVVCIAVLFLLKTPANRPAAPAVVPPAARPAVAVLPTPPLTVPSAPIASSVATSNPTWLAASIPFTTGRVEGDNAEYVQDQINRLEDLQSN